MDFIVIWSEFAELQLDKIYDYYLSAINENAATSLVRSIIKESESLSKMPFIGQLEEDLKGKQLEYRYWIYKNYKLIYSVDSLGKTIRISDVFDTRQEPSKINRKKD